MDNVMQFLFNTNHEQPSIPMLAVFKDGKAVAKSVGYQSKPEIAAMVEGAR